MSYSLHLITFIGLYSKVGVGRFLATATVVFMYMTIVQRSLGEKGVILKDKRKKYFEHHDDSGIAFSAFCIALGYTRYLLSDATKLLESTKSNVFSSNWRHCCKYAHLFSFC